MWWEYSMEEEAMECRIQKVENPWYKHWDETFDRKNTIECNQKVWVVGSLVLKTYASIIL
jgi:hypothetical protein